MYHNYNSLRESIQKEIENQKSVLNKFPEQISRPITQSVSKYLAQFTSYQLPLKPSTDRNSQQQLESSGESNAHAANTAGGPGGSNNNSGNNLNDNADKTAAATAHNNNNNNNAIQLETPEQVNWTLENLMYGLTLSHDHHDIIKDCWHIYHDWLSVLLDEPRAFIPQPIRDEPVYYARKMLWHLYHLFVPRREGQAAPTKHVMMCHGVLMLIESIAKDSKFLRRELWEDFLKFFLAINDAVLAPPFNKGNEN
jgi:hypothetical protein